MTDEVIRVSVSRLHEYREGQIVVQTERETQETDLLFDDQVSAVQRIRVIGDTAAQLSKRFMGRVPTRPEEGGR